MQSPSASDPSFKAFLDKLQEQNNRGFVTQLVQLKAEREIAGEDNDKREEQLDEVISSLKEVREAVTGTKLDIDLTPLVNIGENQTKLLEELSKEAALTRKLTEGSVEYDKEAAQYRNTSGRDIESKVSGKTSKDGGFLDFETARDTLSGQGKRAKEANAFDLKPINYTPGKAVAAAVGGKGKKSADDEEDLNQPAFKGFLEEIKSGFKFFMTDGLSEKPGTGIFQTPSKEVEKKDKEAEISSPIQENPEADNVVSTGEIQADATKSDLEISKQMLDTTKAQLIELKAIREALAPKTPKDLAEQKSGPTTEKEKESEGGGDGGGGLGIGDLLPSGGGIGKALKTAGKGALSLGGKALKFMGGKGGAIAGAALAVGAGAYTAYQGYNAADDSKDAKLKEVQAKVDSGEMKPEEAAAARKEIGNTATVEKSGAVGEGTGMAVGAIAGMKAGAMLGAFGGPIGAGVGAIAGGALGAFAGSSGGKYVGEKIGSGINAVKGFFGGKTDTPGAATKEALAPTPAVVKSSDVEKITNTSTDPKEIEKALISTYPANMQSDISVINDVREEASIQAKVNSAKTIPGGPSAKNSVTASVATGAAALPVVEKKPDNTAAPGAATKEALAPAPVTVKNETTESKATADLQVSDSEFRKKDPENFKKFVDFRDKRRDEIAKDQAKTYGSDKPSIDDIDEATVEAKLEANIKFKKEIEAVSAGKVETKTEEKVTGGPGAKNPAVPAPEALSANQMLAQQNVARAKDKAALVAPTGDGSGTLQSGQLPVVEKKSVDTAAPGKATAVAPIETVDGKKVKPKSLDELALAEAKKYGRTVPDVDDKEVAKDEFDAINSRIPVVEKKTISGTAAGTLPEEKGILSKAADTAKSIGSSIAGFFGFGDKKKPVDTAAPGKAIAVTPKETVDGKLVAVQPSGGDKFRDALSNAVGSAKQMVKNGEVDPKHLDEAVDQVMANVEGVSPQSANVIEKAVRAELQNGLGTATVSKPTLGSGTTGYLDEMKARGINPSDPDGSLKLGLRGPNNAGNMVAKTSTENVDMGREAGKGGSNNTVVSNNVSSNNTTKIVPMRANPRPEYTGSSLDRYTNRITVY